MKKRWFLLFLATVLLFVSSLSLAESISWEEILQSEKWMGLDPTSSKFCFQPDGKGVLEINGAGSIDLTWTLSGDQLTAEYNFYGQRSFTYTMAEVDGVYAMTTEGGMLVRESDCQRMLAESRASVQAYPVQIGEEINLGFANLRFDSTMIARKLQGSSGSGIFMQANQGERLFVATAQISNLGGSAINASNIKADVTLDHSYTYSARCYIESAGEMRTELSARNTGVLNIFAQIPEDMAQSYTHATVYIAFNNQFASSPMTVSDGEFIFEVSFDEEAAKAAKSGPVRQKTFFEECPALAKPDSYADVRNAGSSKSSSGGKYTRIVYRFAAEINGDSISDLMNAYLDGLAADGYIIKGNEVYCGKTQVATITLESSQFEVSIKPGNEKLQFVPQAAAPVQPEETEENSGMLKLGDTIQLENLTMTLQRKGTGTIYSSITPRKNGYYQYIEPQNGNELFYVTGIFTNLGGEPVDIGNIYGEFTFDNKYSYRAQVEGGAKEENIFIRDVSPLNEVTYFLYAEVPPSLLSSYQTCTARIGFTDGFGIKYSTPGGLFNFDYCDDVFEVNLMAGGNPAAMYETLKPGCDRQAVLDARMKLYELGYFQNVPTQTEYTNAMKDYVKKFERDYGLEVDGILSPEDQAVLFAQ